MSSYLRLTGGHGIRDRPWGQVALSRIKRPGRDARVLPGGGGGFSVYFWVVVCRWASETLTLYQTMLS